MSQTAERELQSVEIFDIESALPVRSISVEAYITDLSWRPDGQRLAISQRGPVLIIDPFHEQSEIVSMDTGSNITLWSPDQQTLATLSTTIGYLGEANSFKLWSRDGKTLRLVLQEPSATTLGWSPDSKVIATGRAIYYPSAPTTQTYSIFFWDAQTGELVGTLPQTKDAYVKHFLSVDWSPNGSQIVTTSADNVVRVFDWPLREKKPPRELLGSQDPITSLAWNGQGTQIASTSEDGNILIWDVTSKTPERRFQSSGSRIKTVSWNRVTDQIAFGTNAPYVYTLDFPSAEPPVARGIEESNVYNFPFPEAVLVAYSPDGRWLASVAPEYMINVWSTDDPDNVRTIGPLDRRALSLAWSEDSRKLAYDNTLAYVYDIESGTSSSFDCETSGYTSIIGTVALSPDGTLLVAANMENGVCLWDLTTGELIRRLYNEDGSDMRVGDLVWNPDGTRLALTSLHTRWEGAKDIHEVFVEVWDMSTGKLLASIQNLTSVTDIAWSPDGTRLAAGDLNGLIHILEP